ncbi:hypothetical protein XELAEV_18047655mg [Xenopus laevis]|uniref:Uncharacterized protein n=1 Tax=Xenopus laevis TaxID=8355 RepID=A0A974BVK6_XENLA|nr:hypothetical protein XELAEV_18047655mg [Xenopus laevis]
MMSLAFSLDLIPVPCYYSWVLGVGECSECRYVEPFDAELLLLFGNTGSSMCLAWCMMVSLPFIIYFHVLFFQVYALLICRIYIFYVQ